MTATKPCDLVRLGPDADFAALEAAYVARGSALLACDVARQLAVDVHSAEHIDIDDWLATLE